MNYRASSGILPILLGGASAIVILWGIREAAHILTVLLLALLLAFCILPLPRWMIRRFGMSEGLAIAITVIVTAIGHVVISLLLVGTSIHIKEKMPEYEQQFKVIFERGEVFLGARGINVAGLSGQAKASERMISLAKGLFPGIISIFSDRILVGLFCLLFLVELARHDEAKKGPLARSLMYYGGDVQGFIAVMAKTGAITAVANFVLLLAIGVDFPILWCVLYFFLHFIPDLGIIISVIPPTLLALVTLGWKQALLVAGGILVLNALSDYVLKPRLMEKELNISFLGIMLSLTFWGFVLGPWGGVLAIPLTMALRKFIAKYSGEEEKLATTVSASTA